MIQSAANKEADSNIQKEKWSCMWGTCVYVNYRIPVTQHNATHTLFHLKTKSELWKENFALLKCRFWRKADALLFHFHSQTSTDTVSPWPHECEILLPFILFLVFQKGTLKTVNEYRSHWSPFGLLSPVLKPLVYFAKDWSIPRSENGFFSFFLCFFFSRDYFWWICFLVNERVDPELLYIFLTRLMHSANSFLIFFKVGILKNTILIIHISIQL
jgi:hypothetical protein